MDSGERPNVNHCMAGIAAQEGSRRHRRPRRTRRDHATGSDPQITWAGSRDGVAADTGVSVDSASNADAIVLKEKDLDIVMVSTPDHWHALPSIAAMQAGADVYVEKPVSVDVVEGAAMVAAARKYGRVVQVNTQRRSTPHLIEARDRICLLYTSPSPRD